MPHGFDSVDLSPDLRAVAQELGFSAMTPIQQRSIPILLAGKDLIGQSKTGSGKTAAFTLPILQNIALDGCSLQALVLCPTRELCAQVAREMRRFGRKLSGLQVLVVSGGLPIRTQTAALRRGVHIVVGTPGRVLDHLTRGNLDLDPVTTVVLDEADRMLDMGFAEEMEQIFAALPESRQTALFSATLPPSIVAISRRHQRDAVRVTIDPPAEETLDIRQEVVATNVDEKCLSLLQVLSGQAPASALVFCNLKATVAEVRLFLADHGVSSDCLHGDIDQRDRDRVMAMFRNRSIRVLVATDVAARGLDVLDLDLVVNFDLPAKTEIYIHRIGRTGRAGKLGRAVSFATAGDTRRVEQIEERIGASMERLVPRGARADLTARMGTIRIGAGRKDKIRPGDILGALTGEAGGLKGDDVGKIEIHDRHAFVAVSRAVSLAAVESLRNGRIKGRKLRATLIEPA